MSQESLMKDLGLADFDESHQSELFALMMDVLEIKVLDRVLSELNDAEQKEFTLILLGENVQSAREFLEKRIKNLDAKLDDVIIDYKHELMQDIIDAKKNLLKK